MNNLQRLAENIIDARIYVDKEYKELFNPDNQEIFGRRIEKMCQLLNKYQGETHRSNVPQMIVHDIAINGFREDCYPVSSVDWNVVSVGDKNECFISVTIRAMFKGLEDTAKTLIFPAGDQPFEDFLKFEEQRLDKLNCVPQQEEKKIYSISDLREAIKIAYNTGANTGDAEGEIDVNSWHFDKFGFHLPVDPNHSIKQEVRKIYSFDDLIQYFGSSISEMH